MVIDTAAMYPPSERNIYTMSEQHKVFNKEECDPTHRSHSPVYGVRAYAYLVIYTFVE